MNIFVRKQIYQRKNIRFQMMILHTMVSLIHMIKHMILTTFLLAVWWKQFDIFRVLFSTTKIINSRNGFRYLI